MTRPPEGAAPLVLVGTGPSAPEERRRHLSPRDSGTPKSARPAGLAVAESSAVVDVTGIVELCARANASRRWSGTITPAVLATKALQLVVWRDRLEGEIAVVLGDHQPAPAVLDSRVVPRQVATLRLLAPGGLPPERASATLSDVSALLRDPSEALLYG